MSIRRRLEWLEVNDEPFAYLDPIDPRFLELRNTLHLPLPDNCPDDIMDTAVEMIIECQSKVREAQDEAERCKALSEFRDWVDSIHELLK